MGARFGVLKFVKHGENFVEIVISKKNREIDSISLLSLSLFFKNKTISTNFFPFFINFKKGIFGLSNPPQKEILRFGFSTKFSLCNVLFKNDFLSFFV